MTRAALAVLCLVATARAEPRAIVAALPGEGGDLSRAILVGRSAEIYEASDGGFVRRRPGGVAPDVAGAVRGPGGELWALPRRAPLFRRDAAGVWHAVPLGGRGGLAVASEGSRVALGRQVFALDGGRWKRIASAPAGVSRLSTRGRVSWLVLSDGRLARVESRLGLVPLRLSQGESITFLAADDLGAVFRTSAGTWHRASASGSRPLALPATLTGFEPETAAAGGRGLVVAGSVARPDGSRGYLLARAGERDLAVLEEIAAPPPGDRFVALLATPGGDLLLASGSGDVRRRSAGAPFAPVAILPDLLPATAMPAAAGPARSR